MSFRSWDVAGRGVLDSGNLRSGGGEEMGEQRERGMGLKTSGCLLYTRHHDRHCMYFCVLIHLIPQRFGGMSINLSNLQRKEIMLGKIDSGSRPPSESS